MSNIEMLIVAKFGGSSMANAESIRRVSDVVSSDPDRRFVVVSAPKGTTDLLRKAAVPEGLCDDNGVISCLENREAAFAQVNEVFSTIGNELGCREVNVWLEELRKGIFSNHSFEWSESRGEWLIARIFAKYMGANFIDATELIRLAGYHVNPSSYDLIRERLAQADNLSIIPGYYGLDSTGEIRTFLRGGSDITGAVIAKGVNARLYENWTDVNGVLAGNPNIIDNPQTIEYITYEEMRELGNGGAKVLQRDTILPLIEAGIPINVRNTFNPEHPGTMVVAHRFHKASDHVIGVTAEGGFMSFNIHKYGMNEEVGVGQNILYQFRLSNISYEHSPSGRDYMSVIVNQNQIDDSSFIASSLRHEVKPDNFWIERNLGLLSLVGIGIKDHAVEVLGKLFTALDNNSIAVKALSYGASAISIVVAVDSSRLEDAQKVVYDTFIRNC